MPEDYHAEIAVGLPTGCRWEDPTESSPFLWKSILLVALLLAAPFANGTDVSGTTQIDGLEVSADPAQRGCEIHLDFSGRRITKDVGVTSVHLVRAVDDTGQSLISGNGNIIDTNRATTRWIDLANPSTNARSIDIEGEAELLTPTVPPLVFTNVVEHPGEPLQHLLLKQHHIQIVVFDSKHRPGADATIEWEDPENKVSGLSFQTSEGDEARGPKDSLQFGAMKISCQKLSEPLRDLNLAVRLDMPPKREAFRFKIETIKLAWVQPTNLEVTVTCRNRFKALGPTLFGGMLEFNVRGGPMTNAVGMRKLTITRAEGEAGQKLEMGAPRLAAIDDWLDWRGPLDSGGSAWQVVYMHAGPTRPRSIKVLEGSMELFCPSRIEDAFVKVTNGLNRAGTLFSDPALEKYGIVFEFLGAKNFATTFREMNRTNLVQSGGKFPSDFDVGKMPENVQDSLLFLLKAPQGLVLPGYPQMSFFDSRGASVQGIDVSKASGYSLIRFGTLPQKGEFTFCLTPPESLKVVHFRVENIALR